MNLTFDRACFALSSEIKSFSTREGFRKRPGACSMQPHKLLLIMKFTAIIILSGFLTAAASGSAQTVTLKERQVSLESVFKKIELQTGYSFVFRTEWLSDAKKVNIDVKDASLENVLSECFKDQHLDYAIIDKIVVVKVKPRMQTAVAPSAFIQPIDIKGRIVNEDGEAVEGATIKIKGTESGAITTSSGEFQLTNVDEQAILIISGTNIQTFEYRINKKAMLGNISAKTKVSNMQEVVINKGYYTEKQRLSVGNAITISGKDIQKQPILDPILALQGRVAGLNIQQTMGVPGAYSTIQLRGQNFLSNPSSTIISNDPLYVIDGVPYSSESLSSPFLPMSILGLPSAGADSYDGRRGGVSPFSFLNTANIESITVLKDADATAIYGARGANGVILITTKKPKNGPVKIDINLSTGFSKITKKAKLLNTEQYLEVRRESYKNNGNPYYPFDYDISGTSWDTTRYTDWQEELINRSAAFTNMQANVSGGSANTQFLIGAGYSKQGTTMVGNFSSQNISLFTNISSASSNQHFRIAFSAGYSHSNSNLPAGVQLAKSITLPPDAPELYHPNGTLNWQIVGGSATWENPLAYTYQNGNALSDNLNGSLLLRYRIFEGLDISLNSGYTHSQMNSTSFIPSIATSPPNDNPFYRSAVYATGGNYSWQTEPALSYHKKLGKSSIDVLIGSNFQKSGLKQIANYGVGYSSDAVISNPSAASYYLLSGYNLTEYRYNSVYGRIGYNWNEKYLINLTARRDGSSRFGANRQFGNFGSAGIGWVFSKENFVENNLFWLSFGKLRVSYGSAGSDAIGDYGFIRTYSLSNQFTYQNTSLANPDGHANPYYSWQVNRKLEIGLETGLINNRFNFSISWYSNRSNNQLVAYPLPAFTGATSVTENLPALVENRGWEFIFATENVRSKSFQWSSNFNISFPRNKLISFPGIENTSYKTLYAVGQSLSSRLLYHFIGIDVQQGYPVFSAKNGTGRPLETTSNTLGDMIWSKPLDVQYFGGVGNQFRYKDFILEVFTTFTKRILQTINAFSDFSASQKVNLPIGVLDRWQQPGDITSTPAAVFDNTNGVQYSYYRQSDGVFENNFWIRISNVSLSYSLPAGWQRQAHLTNFRFFIQCQNLFTFSNYNGLDPETGGINIPPMRTITGGIQVSF